MRLGTLSAFALFFAVSACSSDQNESNKSTKDTEKIATSDNNSSTGSNSNSANSQGSASAEIGDELFSFTLGLCTIDDSDVLIEGPGREAVSSNTAFLSIDMTREGAETQGDARIDLGTTQAMQSMDDHRQFTTWAATDYSITYDGAKITVDGMFLTPQATEGVHGTLHANCA